MSNIFFQTDSLTLGYGNEIVINKLKLSLDKTKNYEITGKNGAGKTTLLNFISNNFDGNSFNSKYTKEELDILEISHTPTLLPNLTLSENAIYFTSSKNIDAEIIESAIEKYDLGSYKTDELKNFSSGMIKRAELAIAEMKEPHILCIDEPLNYLDKQGINHLKTLINERAQNSKSNILSSQETSGLLKNKVSEYRNNSSLFLITPTMCVLIIVFPILAENRFAIDEDLFIIIQILFLILFSTLFSIRNPINQKSLTKELNFAYIKKSEYFISKITSEFLIYFPQILLFSILFSVFTNSSVKTNIFTFILTLIFFSINTVMVNIIFQMFTSFNNRFVQFILIVPIYMALSFFIAPIWLGINLHLTNIYLLMYLGITIVIYSYTSFYLERGKL